MVFDINLDDKECQRVLRGVFKSYKQYLAHKQNSNFEGNLLKSISEYFRELTKSLNLVGKKVLKSKIKV